MKTSKTDLSSSKDHPEPCKTCGTCPTCGARPPVYPAVYPAVYPMYPVNPYVVYPTYPYRWPATTWTWNNTPTLLGSQTVMTTTTTTNSGAPATTSTYTLDANTHNVFHTDESECA